MLDKYIKNHGETGDKALADCLVELWKSIEGFEHAVIVQAERGNTVKLSALRKTLTGVLDAINQAESSLKVLRKSSNADDLILVPKGINKVLSRVSRVAADLANATIFAEKSERITLADLVRSYRDSFPVDSLKAELEHHIDVVGKRRRLEADGNPFGQEHADMKKVIESYSKHFRSLPTTLRGMPFKALSLPVAPLFKDLSAQIEPARLSRAGFDVTQVGDGYLVLEDQFLIAFDYRDQGMESGVRKVKGGFRAVRHTGPARTRHKDSAIDKLREILDKLNARSSVKYALASMKFVPNPRNPKLWLAWIVTEHQRTQLAQTLRTVEVDWGLPFGSHGE